MEFSSKLLEKAVNEMSQLPGIGKRTALRLVLHLLKQPEEQTRFLSESLVTMREEIKFCASCHNISDVDLCIGPSQLNIESLVEKVKQGGIDELIFALSSTMEGDTTNFYIFKRLKDLTVKTSTIARGIAVGDELEYADEVTLGRSIINRVPFENTLKTP